MPISRREFLRKSTELLKAFCLLNLPPLTPEQNRTTLALQAAQAAVDSMHGPYSWEEFRTCSTFISAYLCKLGMPINDRNEKLSDATNDFPWSGTLYQAKWLKRNYPDYTHDAPLTDFLEGKLWHSILPGEIIYMTKAVSHNGYDTYFHVAALVDYHDGNPQFAEMANGMKNPSAKRTFAQLTKFYKKPNGSWDTTPSSPKHSLIITRFDPFAVIK